MGESRSYGSSWAFFVYDHSVIKREEDDLKDAILYFYPATMDITAQCLFVGKLMGLAEFLSSCIAHSPPRIYHLEKHKFSLHRRGNYTFALASAPSAGDEQLVSRLHLLLDIFVTYQGSMTALYQRSGKEEFLDELRQVWDSYLLFAHSFTDLVSMAFNAVPSISLPRTESRIFLQASHILQRAQKEASILAGVVIYKGRVLCTQLSPAVTRRFLILKPRQMHLPCIHQAVEFELPQSVRLLKVYILAEEIYQLSPLKVNRLRKGDNCRKPGFGQTVAGDNSAGPAAALDIDKFTAAGNDVSLATVESVVCHSGRDSCTMQSTESPTDLDRTSTSSGSSQTTSPATRPESSVSHLDKTAQGASPQEASSPQTCSREVTKAAVVLGSKNAETVPASQTRTLQQQDFPHDTEHSKWEDSGSADRTVDKEGDAVSVSVPTQTKCDKESSISAPQGNSGIVHSVGSVSPSEKNVDTADGSALVTQECDSAVHGGGAEGDKVDSGQGVRPNKEGEESCDVESVQGAAEGGGDSIVAAASHSVTESSEPGDTSGDSKQTFAGEVDNNERVDVSCGQPSSQTTVDTNVAGSSCPEAPASPACVISDAPGSQGAEESAAPKQDLPQSGNLSCDKDGHKDNEAPHVPSSSQQSQEEVPENSTHAEAGAVCDGDGMASKEEALQTETGESVKTKDTEDTSEIPSVESSDRNISSPETPSSTSPDPNLKPEEAVCSDVERLAEQLMEDSDSDPQGRVAFTARKSIISLMPEPQGEELITSSSSSGERGLSPDDGSSSAPLLPSCKSPETSSGNEGTNNHKFSSVPGTRSSKTSLDPSVFDPTVVAASSSRQDKAAAVVSVGKVLMESADKRQSEDLNGAQGEGKKEEEAKWTAEEDGLVELPLYIQGHQDTVIALLLHPEAELTEAFVHKVFKQALENISDLDAKLHSSPDQQRAKLGSRDAYHFLRYDSFSSDIDGNTLDPVTRSDNNFVDASVSMHEIFQTQPDISEMILKSGSECCYGHRCFTHETFYHEEAALSYAAEGPSHLDPTWRINKNMRSVLLKEKNIVVL